MTVDVARDRSARICERQRCELAVAERVRAAVGGEERVLESRRVLPESASLRAPRRDGARERVARVVEVARRHQAGLRAARSGRRAARHQELQLGRGRQVIDRAAQVADAARTEHRLLDLQDAARVATVGVEIDRREHAAVRAADREGHVDRTEQVVPVADFVRVGRLREAHQRKLREHDVVRQRFAQELVDATLVGREHRARRERPFGRQRLRSTWAANNPDSDQRDDREQHHGQHRSDRPKRSHHEPSTPERRNFPACAGRRLGC